MDTNTPKSVALAYHQAFHNNDRAAVRSLLADIGVFRGPLNIFTDPDAFLDGAAIFMKLSQQTNIKKVIAEGDDVCVLYDYAMRVPGIPVIPLASWFRVADGRCDFFHTHFDPVHVLRAKESGAIAAALKA